MVVDLAARPHITAGIALASAVAITAGPMAQHLPDLHLAQHLSTVSVSTINLTDASSALDLFAGVENELASLASGAAAASLPAPPTGLPLPIQTWVNTFASAGTNLQTILNTWSKLPFPVAQQVAANWLYYADTYVGSFQNFANAAVKYFGAGGTFWTSLQRAATDFQTGNITTGFGVLYNTLFQTPALDLGTPLQAILKTIPVDITQNLANATKYLNVTGVTQVINYGVLGIPGQMEQALGSSLQAVYNSWTAGDPVGLLTSLANAPGALTNAALNGVNGQYGLLSPAYTLSKFLPPEHTGVLDVVLNYLGPNLANAIASPGAQPIANGGSLATAFQTFVNQLVTGWPSLSNVSGLVSNLGGQLTAILQNVPSFLSNLPSMLGSFTGQIGTLLINLLKLL
ncbi:hypothetical protein BMG05_24095 [Mycobacterium malmoense]|nr:hypothetical protein BMG05_24095 [Mycobacterium malmoense]